MGIENNNSKCAKENDDYNYIVVAIEVLSRYTFAIPTKKKDKRRSHVSNGNHLEEFHNYFDSWISEIYSK